MLAIIVWAPSRPEALQRMERTFRVCCIICKTNVRFLAELCSHPDVVDGWTTTDMIAKLWPDIWSPDQPTIVDEAGLLIAAVCEQTNHGKKIATSSSTSEHVSPFSTLSRRYP